MVDGKLSAVILLILFPFPPSLLTLYVFSDGGRRRSPPRNYGRDRCDQPLATFSFSLHYCLPHFLNGFHLVTPFFSGPPEAVTMTATVTAVMAGVPPHPVVAPLIAEAVEGRAHPIAEAVVVMEEAATDRLPEEATQEEAGVGPPRPVTDHLGLALREVDALKTAVRWSEHEHAVNPYLKLDSPSARARTRVMQFVVSSGHASSLSQ